MYMLLTGDFVTAEQALRMGLVSEIVEGNCDQRALELAQQLAALPPLTRDADQGCRPVRCRYPAQLGAAHRDQAHELMYGTQDMREGTEAFAQKRSPDYKGR